MSYTPINWQSGDVITAEKLNKMDNGWSIESAQLFSETVTTVNDGDFTFGMLEYVFTEEPPTHLTITFNNVEYVCERQIEGDYFYGAPSPFDFSTYPFLLYCDPEETYLYTENAGTYTISASGSKAETSQNFQMAVNDCVDTSTMPMLCVTGVTTINEMIRANSEGRLLYFRPYDGTTLCIITYFDPNNISFIPETSGITASFNNDIFTVGLI